MGPRIDRRTLCLAGGGFALFGSAGCIGPVNDNLDDDGATDDTDSADIGEDDTDDRADQDGPPNQDPITGTIDTFEDLTQWEAWGGILTGDTTIGKTGSQSAKISVGTDDIRGAIIRTFDPPIDLTGRRPQLAGKVEKGNIRPWITFVDVDGNRCNFRSFMQAELDLQYFDFGIEGFDGVPDFSQIAELRINAYLGEERRNIWFDALRFSERVDPGIVVIQFDDTVETDYTKGLPILSEHDLVASTFVNPGYTGRTVGQFPRMSLAQLESLQDAGWDVCNHGMNHHNLSQLPEDKQEEEILDAYDWLVDHGFDGANYFAYAFAAYDQSAIDIVGSYHDLAFDAGYPSLGPCANPYLIQRSLADPTAERAKQDIDLTVEYGGITTIYYHNLYGEREGEFAETVAYLADKRATGDLRVERVSDIAAEYLDPTI